MTFLFAVAISTAMVGMNQNSAANAACTAYYYQSGLNHRVDDWEKENLSQEFLKIGGVVGVGVQAIREQKVVITFGF